MTREELLHAIDVRHACRRFSGRALNEAAAADIIDKIKSINSFSGLDFQFAEDGSRAFSSILRTYGLFSNVRSLIMVMGRTDTAELAEKCGYFGEQLVLELTAMGFGTCWVAGTYDRRVFAVPDNEKLLCVIPVGYPAQEDFLVPQTDRKRRPAEKRFIIKDGNDSSVLPQWFMDGIRAMCQAPSALNSQKPYIEINAVFPELESEGRTHGSSDVDMLDLGIAERHFAIGADKGITTAYFLGEFSRDKK